jgi:thioredoxin 1
MSSQEAIYKSGLSRSDVDALEGPLVLNFGTNWCGYCSAAWPIIAEALQTFPTVKHLGVEDGPGRALGRSFHVKLWPTLIFLKNGTEVARLVRPSTADELRSALQLIA